MNTTSHEAPRFQHDCDRCTYLGQHEEYDLYFCGNGFSQTVIARWSNNGPEYSSGIEGSYIQTGALYEARKRAQQAGLVAYDLKMAAFYLQANTAPELLEEFRSELAESEVGKTMELMLSDEAAGISKVKDFMQSRMTTLQQRHPDKEVLEMWYDWLVPEMDRYQVAATIVGAPTSRWPWVQAVSCFRPQ